MRASFLVVATLASACTGVVGTARSDRDPSPSTPSTPSTPPSDPGGKLPGDPGTNLDCSRIAPGPSFVRRLNRFEYDNTVRDLLGTSTRTAAQFPVEERRNGFDNDAALLQVSPALAEQYLTSAEKLASGAVAQLAEVLPCDPARDGEDACGRTFIAAFGAKAFRRPLTPEHTARLWGVFDAGRKLVDFSTGIELVIETVLQSPEFLYRVEFGVPPADTAKAVKLTSWEMASRLSYLLWQSMPDDVLRQEAAQDGLLTSDAVIAQVNRMIADPRAREVVTHFNDLWLHLEDLAAVEKDAKTFPGFRPELVPLMAEETHRFLDDVIWDGPGDVQAMLTAPYSFMNAKLATYYGVRGPTGENFVRVELDQSQRLGLLTQGGVLSLLAKANQTAPVQRGKFIREQLMCEALPPPPADIIIRPPELSPTLSTRDRFAAHRASASCSGCHQLMDPIGLALENYDGAGMYRATENGSPIDASGEIVDGDVAGPFSGAAGLAQKLAQSEQVKRCVATSWFRYAYGRAETDADACTLAAVNQKFKTSGYKIKDLIVALTTTDAFLYRPYILPGGEQ